MTITPATLYGLGAGPGDPELLTLKALHILQAATVVAVPYSRRGEESYALQAVAPHLKPNQDILRLHFPMLRDSAQRQSSRAAAAAQVLQRLEGGQDVVFLTEGDPLLHSTFYYIMREMPAYIPVVVVPGVSSLNAAAAAAAVPLVYGSQRLAVLPTVFEDEAGLRRVLADFDTVVLLKVHPVLDRLIPLLEEMGLLESALLVERASHPQQRVWRDLRAAQGEAIHYLSLVIVRRVGSAGG